MQNNPFAILAELPKRQRRAKASKELKDSKQLRKSSQSKGSKKPKKTEDGTGKTVFNFVNLDVKLRSKRKHSKPSPDDTRPKRSSKRRTRNSKRHNKDLPVELYFDETNSSDDAASSLLELDSFSEFPPLTVVRKLEYYSDSASESDHEVSDEFKHMFEFNGRFGEAFFDNVFTWTPNSLF